MAEHMRDEEKAGADLDYEAKYNAYMEWLDEQDAQREKVPYSKIIVAMNIILIILFTLTQLQLIWQGKNVNDTLIRCFFACFGFEFGCLAFTHRTKLKYTGGNGATSQMPHIELKEDDDEQVSE